MQHSTIHHLVSFLTQPQKLAVLFLVSLLSLPQLATANTHFAGATLGEFQVGQNGEAIYAIPLTVPPGINGMQPNLALTYNSQSGNGLLGMGWSLSGLSAITRCPQTLAQDNNIHGVDFTSEDRFCLDGQRLVAVNGIYGDVGTEYRTEMESYSKISSMGGSLGNPAWFEVRTKDGKIKEYGNTVDSFVSAVNASTGTQKIPDTAVSWALNKVSDRAKNYYTYVYAEITASGEHYITSIHYTGNSRAGRSPFASIQFYYDLRVSDNLIGFLSGSKTSILKKLNNIKTYVGSKLVNYYKFSYIHDVMSNHIKLTSISECDNKSVEVCKNSTQFIWQEEGNAIFDQPISTQYSGSGWGAEAKLADVNGDGLTDFIYTGSQEIQVGLSLGDGTFTQPIVTKLPGSGWNVAAKLADINGDGLTDFVYTGSQVLQVCLAIRDGSGTFTQPIKTQYPGSGWDVEAKLADINGDGLTDFIFTGSNEIQVGLSRGDGTFKQPITTKYPGSGWNAAAKLADINGDGLTDFIYTGSQAIQVGLSLGDGTFTQPIVTKLPGSGWNVATKLADINGDGLADFIYTGSQVLQVGLSKGDGTFKIPDSTSKTTYPGSGWNAAAKLADINGDGFIDFVYTGSSTLQTGKYLGNKSNLILIKDGMNKEILITYKPITDSSVHTLENNYLCKVGVNICTLYPMYIVSSYSKSNGNVGIYSQSYKYTGIKTNIEGRGSLGFSKIFVTDDKASVISVTQYQQNFPFVGVVAWSTTKQLNGKRVSAINNSWIDLYNTDPSRFNIKPVKSDTYSYELNGSQTTHVTTSNTYGGENGEVTNLLITSNDGYSKSTTNSYYPADTFNWIIGQLKTTAIISTTPNGNGSRQSKFTYEPLTGLVKTEVIEPGNADLEITKTYVHDVYGNKTSTTVSGNATARHKFTARTSTTTVNYSQISNATTPKIIVTSSNALGHTSTKVIDARYGKLINVTGANGITTSWQYDSLGRKIKELRADGSYTTIDYQLCQSGTTCIDPIQQYLQSPLAIKSTVVDGVSSNTSVIYFDKLGRECLKTTKGFSGKTLRVKTEYDTFGRVAKVSLPYISEIPTHNPNTDPSVYWTSYQYDLLGRMTTETNADNSTTTVAYNGLTTTTTNNLWQTITKTKNSQGQLISTTDANNNSNTYQYDAFGKMVRVTDALSNVSSMSYNKRGFKTSMNDADMGRWSYQYNGLGELVSQTDAKAQTTTMAYDTLGRIKTRTEPEGTTTWFYDTAANGKGKLDTVTSPNGYSRTHFYDNLGRPKSTTVNNNGINYTTSNTYIANSSRINTTSYPGGQIVKYNYDSFGYLKAVDDGSTNKNLWTAQFTDAFGNITQEKFGNNIITTRGYQPTTGRLSTIMSGLTISSAALQNLSYTFDSLGNLKTRNDNNNSLSEVLTYDNLNRLKTSTMNALPQKTFSYDAIGNITNKSDVGAYTYDNGAGIYTTLTGGPHAVHKVGNNTYTYDKNGNQLSGTGRTLSYTSFNKPASITRNSVSNVIYYDADHNRVEKISSNAGKTTTTFYLGKAYQQVKSSSGLIEDKYFINAGGATVLITKRSTKNNDVRYLLKDHIGSTDIITDELGKLVPGENLSFDAWGKRRQANWSDAIAITPITSLTNLGFTGHEMDDGVGLINMNARMYDAEIGRFLSPDTFIQFPDTTQGLNRYTYVNNNPLSYTDPSGHFSLKKTFRSVKRFVNKHKKSIARAFTLGWLAPIAYSKPVKNEFLKHKNLRLLGSLTAGILDGMGCSSYCSAIYSAYLTDISGGSNEDILRAGATSYVSGRLFAFANGTGWEGASDIEIFNKIVGNTLVGGVSAKMQGGDFNDGMKTALISSMARAVYVGVVEYDVDAKPGDNSVAKTYWGRPVKGRNNIGFAGNKDYWYDEWDNSMLPAGEGAPLSVFANNIPGVNAVAGLHDIFQLSVSDGIRNSMIYNVGGMFVAAGVTYTALMSGQVGIAMTVENSNIARGCNFSGTICE